MRYLRAVVAGGVLLLILGGIPLVLVAIGDPRPGWVAIGVGDVSDTALLAVLASLAWLAWAYFTATVIVEIAGLVRAGARVRLRHPQAGTSRHLAHTLLAAVVVALPLTGPTQAFATARPPAASATGLPSHRGGIPLGQVRTPAGTGGHAPTTSPTAAAPTPAATSAARMATPAADDLREYVVTRDGPGTFWELGTSFLGDGLRWREIWDLNRGRRQDDGTLLRSPGLLRIGWTVLVPAPPKHRPTQAGRATSLGLVYVVHEGDRLGAIAERYLGAFSAYPRIRDANPALFAAVAGPGAGDHIEPGWHLDLPAGAHDRGPLPHAGGHTTHRVPDRDDRPSPVPTPPPVPVPGPTGVPAIHPPVSSSPGSSSPAADPGAATPARNDDQGITIPGGWVDLPLALALAGLAAAVWIRRRLAYLYPPSQDGVDERDDDDLNALPTVVTRLRRAVRDYAEQLPDAFPSPDDTGDGEPVTALTRHRGDQLALRPLQPAPGGLGLIGAGALDAARALVVATLTAHVRDSAPGRGRVLLTRTALDTLLPDWDVTDGRFGDHLMIADDPGETLALLHAHPARSGTVPTPLLLITEPPPAPQRARLTRAIQAAGVPTVVLGSWPEGASLTVQRDGHITASPTGRSAGRIAVLDEPTTLSLLQVLQEASPPRRPTPPSRSAPESMPDHYLPTPETGRSPHDHPAAPDSLASQHESPERIAPGPMDGPLVAGRVAVSVLGKPTIRGRDGHRVTGLRRHASELLVYLAVHRDGASLPAIMEAIWPDATMRRAQQRLSTETANLRRCIRSAAGDPTLQPVVNTGGRYHLDPALLDIDLWRLLDHLDAASATTDPHVRAAELQAAVAVPPAVLADTTDYDWIDAPREHLRRRTVKALLALAEHPDTGPSDAADLTTQAADLDPASEDLAQRTMRALAAVGRTEAIGKRLERLRRTLTGIGENPSPATVQLAADLAATASKVLR